MTDRVGYCWQCGKALARGDEWRLASEPPEDGRDVVVWMDDGGCFAIGYCLRGEWRPNYFGSPVTHWRDVTPPTEGAK